MERFVIIVAGGSGQRMESPVPKQFMLLHNRPVLMHVFDVFQQFDPSINFVLVLNRSYFEQWQVQCKEYGFTTPHQLIEGGVERFYSVKNGLERVPKQVLVAVHDAVRPLVSLSTLNRCFQTAETDGNAIPVISVSDSYRIKMEQGNQTIDRSLLKIVQTPQVFRSEMLKQAYNQEYDKRFTDDALVLESAGFSINLVEGNPENIKITLPTDLLLAEALFKTSKIG